MVTGSAIHPRRVRWLIAGFGIFLLLVNAAWISSEAFSYNRKSNYKTDVDRALEVLNRGEEAIAGKSIDIDSLNDKIGVLESRVRIIGRLTKRNLNSNPGHHQDQNDNVKEVEKNSTKGKQEFADNSEMVYMFRPKEEDTKGDNFALRLKNALQSGEGIDDFKKKIKDLTNQDNQARMPRYLQNRLGGHGNDINLFANMDLPENKVLKQMKKKNEEHKLAGQPERLKMVGDSNLMDTIKRQQDEIARLNGELNANEKKEKEESKAELEWLTQLYLPLDQRPYPKEVPRDPLSRIPTAFFGYPEYSFPHDFKTLHNNETLCKGLPSNTLQAIVPIVSAPGSFGLRNAIRKSYGSVQKVDNLHLRYVFILGHPTTSNYDHPHLIQQRVDLEAKRFKDISQEEYEDDYANFTLKAIHTLKWVATHCREANFMVRLNDDVIFNPFKFVRFSEGRDLRKFKLYMGQTITDQRVVHIGSKYSYTSKINWKDGGQYPVYVNGPHIAMSIDVVMDMFLMAERTPRMFPEDVYQGVLAEKLGLEVVDFHNGFLDMEHINWFQYWLGKPDVAIALHIGTNPNIETDHRSWWKKIMAIEKPPEEDS